MIFLLHFPLNPLPMEKSFFICSTTLHAEIGERTRFEIFWMEYFPPFSLITTHLYVGAPGISWYNSPQYSSTAPSYGMNKTSQLPPLQSFSWCRCCSWQFQVFGSCGSLIIPHVINTQRAVPIITIYIYSILFTSALLLIHADVSFFNKGHQYVISWPISPCAYLCNWC